MKLTVLVDNNTIIDRYFYGEPGVSYFIEDEGMNILYDAGYSDAFLKNAQKMDINVRELDAVVISHGHNDHTWGLVPLITLYSEATMEKMECKKPTLIAHPLTFMDREFDGEEIGSMLSPHKLSKHFHMKLTKEPLWITDKLVFLGQIERTNHFENKQPIGKIQANGIKLDDYLLDDSALAYKSSKGLVIITACSHPGICNIIEYAKKICNEHRIYDIIGGFHLLNPSVELINSTTDYMKKENINHVHACHCTDLKSKIALSKVVNLEEVGVGLVLEYK